jgi:hypothetical protein
VAPPATGPGVETQAGRGFEVGAATEGQLAVPAGWIAVIALRESALATDDEAVAVVDAALAATEPDGADFTRWVILKAPTGTFSVWRGAFYAEPKPGDTPIPPLTDGFTPYWSFGCGFVQWRDTSGDHIQAWNACGTAVDRPAPPLSVELQFCALEQGRVRVRELLGEMEAGLGQPVGSSDAPIWQTQRELRLWMGSWDALLGGAVTRFDPTNTLGVDGQKAVRDLDYALEHWGIGNSPAGYSIPAPDVALPDAIANVRALVDGIDATLAAIPELACGSGLN